MLFSPKKTGFKIQNTKYKIQKKQKELFFTLLKLINFTKS